MLHVDYTITGDQTAGLRYTGVDIPHVATIINAYIQFKLDEANSEATSLLIEGEDIADAQSHQ